MSVFCVEISCFNLSFATIFLLCLNIRHSVDMVIVKREREKRKEWGFTKYTPLLHRIGGGSFVNIELTQGEGGEN